MLPLRALSRPARYKEGDWLSYRSEGATPLVGEVLFADKVDEEGKYLVHLQGFAPPGRPEEERPVFLVPAEKCDFLGFPVAIGRFFDEAIEQGLRECLVLEVKGTRFRIEFELPSSVQRAWRQGTLAEGCPLLFYHFGEVRLGSGAFPEPLPTASGM